MNVPLAMARGAAHRRPLWLGVLLAPWVAPFALTIVATAWDAVARGEPLRFAPALELFAFALVFGLPIAYAATALLGLPCAWWLRRRGALSTRGLCAAGLPLGAVAFPAGVHAFGGHLAFVPQVGIGALLGAAVALAFGSVCGIAWRH